MSDPFPGRPTVTVIGGGYGGVTTARELDDVADVVLVEPKDAFVHYVAALRALVDPSWLPRIYLLVGGVSTPDTRGIGPPGGGTCVTPGSPAPLAARVTAEPAPRTAPVPAVHR